jgi:hypothetical protein
LQDSASGSRGAGPKASSLSPPRRQVELKVLQHLKAHDPEDAHNVIHLSEHFMFRGHLCITFEMLSINL